MKITESQLRSVIRSTLIEEGKFADVMGAVGKHGSKLVTRPAGIIAKALGRLINTKDTSGYEKRIDANVKGLENLVGKIMNLGGRGLEMGYDQFEKLVYKVAPDLHPDEIEALHKEIDAEKKKHGGTLKMLKNRFSSNPKGFGSKAGETDMSFANLAAESRIRRRRKR